MGDMRETRYALIYRVGYRETLCGMYRSEAEAKAEKMMRLRSGFYSEGSLIVRKEAY
jgi:hypothetical protein